MSDIIEHLGRKWTRHKRIVETEEEITATAKAIKARGGMVDGIRQIRQGAGYYFHYLLPTDKIE